MHCGTPGRTPPRRPAFVGRLVRLVLLLLVTLTISVGPASSYPCGTPSGTRTVSGNTAKETQCGPSGSFKRRGNADPLSFAFFIGIIAAVVLVPVTLGRRQDLPPE